MRSYALLEQIGKKPAVKLEDKLMDFAALCGIRCLAPRSVELVCTNEREQKQADALLETARLHLLKPGDGAAEAALALVLHRRKLPVDLERYGASPDLRLVLELRRGLPGARLEEGAGPDLRVDQRTVRRAGAWLAMNRAVDPEWYRDLLVWHLAVTGLGGDSKAFRDSKIRFDHGINDLELPRDAPTPPVPGDGDYLRDLVYWLRARPFRTTLMDYLGD
jgi:hypothetical protein